LSVEITGAFDRYGPGRFRDSVVTSGRFDGFRRSPDDTRYFDDR